MTDDQDQPLQVTDEACACTGRPLLEIQVVRAGETDEHVDVNVRMSAHIHGLDELQATWSAVGESMERLAIAARAYVARN